MSRGRVKPCIWFSEVATRLGEGRGTGYSVQSHSSRTYPHRAIRGQNQNSATGPKLIPSESNARLISHDFREPLGNPLSYSCDKQISQPFRGNPSPPARGKGKVPKILAPKRR